MGLNPGFDTPDVRIRRKVLSGTIEVATTPKKTELHSALESFSAECSDSFLDYIDRLDLLSDPDFVVIPANQHYYFDVSELKKVSTVITLKQLNQVKHLDHFLDSIASGLGSGGSLVGCFVDHLFSRGSGVDSRGEHHLAYEELIDNGVFSSNPLYNRIIHMLDSRLFRRLSGTTVRQFLESAGFVIENMYHSDGITFFHSSLK